MNKQIQSDNQRIGCEFGQIYDDDGHHEEESCDSSHGNKYDEEHLQDEQNKFATKREGAEEDNEDETDDDSQSQYNSEPGFNRRLMMHRTRSDSSRSWSSLGSEVTLDSALMDVTSFLTQYHLPTSFDDDDVTEDELTSSERFKSERSTADPSIKIPTRASLFEDELNSSDRFKSERRSSLPIIQTLGKDQDKTISPSLPVRKPIRQHSNHRIKSERRSSLPVVQSTTSTSPPPTEIANTLARQPSTTKVVENCPSLPAKLPVRRLSMEPRTRPRSRAGNRDNNNKISGNRDHDLCHPHYSPTGSKRQHSSPKMRERRAALRRRGKRSDFLSSVDNNHHLDHHHHFPKVTAPPNLPVRGSSYCS